RENVDVANWRRLECFRGVVDEIDDHAAEQGGIGANCRQTVGERAREANPVETPSKDLQRFTHNVVGASGFQFGGRETHELREFVNERGESAYFAFNQMRRLFDETSQLGIKRFGGLGFRPALQMPNEALRRKLDRRQRILDLVSDAPSDFLPGG